jgi:glyoxylase-like metal-dependent hydrolase (beta-lactamase superfamily II)
MDAGYYKFAVGTLECTCLNDGCRDYAISHFFANAPAAEIAAALRDQGLPTDHYTTPYTFLFVDTGDHRVLVDMGAGDIMPGTGYLRTSLEAADIDPRGIDAVVITHAHPDHIGGTLRPDGSPAYPNARYYVWQREWDFWFSGELTSAGRFAEFARLARERLGPVKDRVSLLHLTDREEELFPGLTVMSAPGHTPGHFIVCFTSGSECLVNIGDAALSPLHLEHPGWKSIYDVVPAEADAAMKKVFDLCADRHAWVVAQHFPPFPSLGHVARSGEGWRWQPASPG